MDDKNAGLALFQAIIALLIFAVIGYVVFRLVKPSTDYWERSPHNYGRLYLAYTLGFLSILISLAFFGAGGVAGINFLAILGLSIPTIGPLSYLIGYLYGKSKPVASTLVKEAKTSIKKTIEKSVEKSVKTPKTVEEKIRKEVHQELSTAKNAAMDDENSEEIGDEEFYLTATKEAEGKDRDEALWAKCMAISEGDEKKAKYGYIKKRVSILIKESIDKNNEKIALEKKIKKESDFRNEMERLKKENDSLTELQIIRKQEYMKLLKPFPSDKSRNFEQELATNDLFPLMRNSNTRLILIKSFEKNVNEIINNQ